MADQNGLAPDAAKQDLQPQNSISSNTANTTETTVQDTAKIELIL